MNAYCEVLVQVTEVSHAGGMPTLQARFSGEVGGTAGQSITQQVWSADTPFRNGTTQMECSPVSGSNTEAVAHGLRTTGAIITGAALIMVAVFGGFAAGDLVAFQQMGFGLAVAVFMDATVIRSVLVPATMRLLGNVNWYIPRWLEWLPRLDIEGHEAAAVAQADRKEPAAVG